MLWVVGHKPTAGPSVTLGSGCWGGRKRTDGNDGPLLTFGWRSRRSETNRRRCLAFGDTRWYAREVGNEPTVMIGLRFGRFGGLPMASSQSNGGTKMEVYFVSKMATSRVQWNFCRSFTMGQCASFGNPSSTLVSTGVLVGLISGSGIGMKITTSKRFPVHLSLPTDDPEIQSPNLP